MRGLLRTFLLGLAVAGLESSPAPGHSPPTAMLRVAGRVVDSEQTPVAGAWVCWSPGHVIDGRPTLTVEAETNAEGRFELSSPDGRELPPESDQWGFLWVVASDHALAISPAYDFREGANPPAMRLSPPAPFRLCVVDPDERPRAGELVEPLHVVNPERQMVDFPRKVCDRLSGITDANGEHRVNCFRRGERVGFRVVSEQFGIYDEIGAEAREVDSLVTIPMRAPARLDGMTVGDNVKAFAGLRLRVTSYVSSPTPILNRVTDLLSQSEVVVGDDGRFVVPSIGAGTLSVLTRREGRLDNAVVTAPRTVSPGHTATIVLGPEPTTIFRGTVVTEGTNEPVADATVTISAGQRFAMQTTATDSAGRYSVTSFARNSELRAISRGQIVECRESVEANAAPGMKVVECPPIKLPPVRSIRGQLVDTAGAPVSGAEVIGLEVAIHHGKGTSSTKGEFELVTAADRAITDYIVHIDMEPRTVTVQSRDPLVLVLDEKTKSD
ncbi:hypothetical protein Pan44_40130 [Caulifigura coniformis]|uniref:Nickel uptake substrate-specific transmembrane region n=1 Tax=Caulifigura coniformis TaxID=2527983 RepID=A0A517SIK7_9PLAN|nr:carboxypeptidase-like regulatory domain-containing protein [Caulifigura coniformis]QDT55964.1 hypothetical protein Pan44_40130 [Caulifigura coniformis]